jgi:hypothetical protein
MQAAGAADPRQVSRKYTSGACPLGGGATRFVALDWNATRRPSSLTPGVWTNALATAPSTATPEEHRRRRASCPGANAGVVHEDLPFGDSAVGGDDGSLVRNVPAVAAQGEKGLLRALSEGDHHGRRRAIGRRPDTGIAHIDVEAGACPAGWPWQVSRM